MTSTPETIHLTTCSCPACTGAQSLSSHDTVSTTASSAGTSLHVQSVASNLTISTSEAGYIQALLGTKGGACGMSTGARAPERDKAMLFISSSMVWLLAQGSTQRSVPGIATQRSLRANQACATRSGAGPGNPITK